MNLGAILHLNGKLSEAEANYLRALQLKPDDVITQSNLRKLWNIMDKQGLRTKQRRDVFKWQLLHSSVNDEEKISRTENWGKNGSLDHNLHVWRFWSTMLGPPYLLCRTTWGFGSTGMYWETAFQQRCCMLTRTTTTNIVFVQYFISWWLNVKKGQLFQIQECIDWVKGFRKKKNK